MKFQALFFFLSFTCMYLCLAQGSYSNCCIGYAANVKPNVFRRIKSYRIQETDGDCNLPAVVFLFRGNSSTKKARSLCGNPQDNWVHQLRNKLDQKLRKVKA